MKLINKLLSSFDTHSLGFSARKLSAFAGVITAITVTFIWMKPEYLLEIVGLWLIFALLCLGIVTIEQVIRLKNGNDKPPDVT